MLINPLDVQHALDHFNESYDTQYRREDMVLKPLGKLSVRQFRRYDDVDAWLETDADIQDAEAQAEALIGFRGPSWAKLAIGWKVIPAVIVVKTPEASCIGDGRGRINFANLYRLKIPAVLLSPRKK